MSNYGWEGSFSEFLTVDKDHLVNSLCLHVYDQTLHSARTNPREKSTISQIEAWFDCINYLIKEINNIRYLQGFLIFEYEILRSGGRRPDVLLFLPGEIVVLEFKRYTGVDDSDYTQLSHYIRDIQSYQSAVQQYNLNVRGALVLTNQEEMLKAVPHYQLYLLGQRSLRHFIYKIEDNLKDVPLISARDFLNGTFQPLPSIIESAKAIMREETLPQIKTVKTSNFDNVIAEVKRIVETAKRNKSHHLVLISGVPGAGKTFVGLTLAHDIDRAVYLSGNAPLVDVLQDTLKDKTFVQPLYGYKNDYLRHQRIPDEHIIIFDEAQRAWDAKRMKMDKSEPDIIIEMAKHKPWSVVVGLIGEGQEIHLGEEGGISLWNEAIKNKNFHVHARHHQEIFPNAQKYYENTDLHLKTSLRTHNALTYFEWVESFIAGDFEHCKALKDQLTKNRFTLKFMDSLHEAKEYVRKTYEGTDKTYGVVISSAIRNPKEIKVVPFSDRYVVPKHHVAYFNYPESRYHCTKLKYAATEFQVQGLELDMAIVYWGEDLQWKNGEWKASHLKRGSKNPYQMKLNAYRVLLTRGRDGVIICGNYK